jgi:excisionase family DNA binding protein
MSYTESADYCAVDRVTLWRAVKRGELRVGGVGRAVRFHRDDLDEFMRSGGNASRR